MQQTGADQFAHQELHAARLVERVHVLRSVRIDACEQRHGLGDVVEIVPRQVDAGGARDRDEVEGVVGRSAGRVQPDDAVDDGALVDHLADRRVLVAERGDRQRPLGRRPGQRIAERRVRIDERGAGQVQAHDLHQHLVAVGRAVEGARAWRVVRLRLDVEELLAGDLLLGVKLPRLGAFRVGQAGGHRSGRDEHRRDVAEGQRRDHQAGHDLVADAEIDGRVEHVVRQADAGRHRDRVAREQRQLHAGLPLRDAVAHRRHAARDLRRAAGLARASRMISGKRSYG